MNSHRLATPPRGAHWKFNRNGGLLEPFPGAWARMDLLETDTGVELECIYIGSYKTHFAMWLASWFAVQSARSEMKRRRRTRAVMEQVREEEI